MRKPRTIVYGTLETPPFGMLLALSFQQVLVLSLFLVSPVLIANAAGVPSDRARNLVSLTMVALAFATVLQIGRRGPVGSGLLVVASAQSVYLPGCLIAARDGGLPAVSALLITAAALEMGLSQFVRRLRGILPTELSGLIVLVTGLEIARSGMNDIVGGATARIDSDLLPSLGVAMFTLALMVGCSVWGRGPLRTLGAIAGLLAGYVVSLAIGLVDPAALQQVATTPLLHIPAIAAEWPDFRADLLMPALISGLAVTLNSTGALTAAQRLNDADWKRQDMKGLSRGLLADGLGTLVAALIGGGGVAASASAVGLTANARATSRAIGYATAAGFLLLSFVPKFTAALLAIPSPVLGAALVFLSCSLLMSGLTIISSRLLDARKTYTLGVAFAFAVATPPLVRVGADLPGWMAPVIASPLLTAALVALVLNPVLRLGIGKQLALAIPPGGLPPQDVADFIARAGSVWGARREVIEQAQGAIVECLDAIADAGLAEGNVRLVLAFNELQFDARISWKGEPLPLSATRPTKEEMLMDDNAAVRMAGYLINHLSSRVTSGFNNGTAEVRLVFDH
jgi:xanthine permease XanP